MFRGGKVDSRGTGITSGLSYGGRVGLQGGGMPPTGNPRFINLGGGQGPTTIGGRQIYQRPVGPPAGSLRGPIGRTFTRGRFKFPMLSSQARAAMGLGFPSMSTLGLMSLPFAPTAAIMTNYLEKTRKELR